MPALAPFGFQNNFDATASRPFSDLNYIQVPINTNVNYFANDIAILIREGAEYPNPVPDDIRGFVYPLPLPTSPNIDSIAYTVLGVFQSFFYIPAGNPTTTIPVESTNFLAGTNVKAGTTPYARVLASPTMLWNVQTSSTTGIDANLLFSYAEIGSPNTPQTFSWDSAAPGASQLYFPMGETTQFGASQTFINISTDYEATPSITNPVGFFVMTNINGSGFTTLSQTITNPIVTVSLPQNEIIRRV